VLGGKCVYIYNMFYISVDKRGGAEKIAYGCADLIWENLFVKLLQQRSL